MRQYHKLQIGIAAEEGGGRRFAVRLEKTLGFILIIIMGLAVSGCLVGNDEYDEARRQKDQYRSELNELHQANDFLNKEIARLYSACEVLSSQLALTAALSIHDRYTAGLQRPAPPPAQPERTTAATNTGRRNPGTAAATPSRSGQSQTQTSRPPNRTGAGGTQTQPSRPSGGTTTPPPPPPMPSPSPGGNFPSGSVDWGI